MRTIYARNVNDAWLNAINLINEIGEVESSRMGTVRVAPCPVVSIYDKPTERVLFDPVRDANPIFHLHESLWMLAGDDDARWLDQFVSDFSARFAEDDGRLHGAYGYRWRNHFASNVSIGGDRYGELNQLGVVAKILTKDPTSRQALIQMWDCETDLIEPSLKDRPCNTQIYLRILDGTLELCTTARSNDIVWGVYGANAVHLSILQEYLAARIGVPVGKFTQFSWNWHMYDSTRHLADLTAANGWKTYPGTIPLVDDPKTFDKEVKAYVRDPHNGHDFKNTFFESTARPMFLANEARKAKEYKQALDWAYTIVAPDWRQATIAWLERRQK